MTVEPGSVSQVACWV